MVRALAIFLAALPILADWPHYGGDQEATRYSPAAQINRANVAKLRIAWTYRTGDALDRPRTTIESTPIVRSGRLYLTTARLAVVALDPATGRELWRFDHFKGDPSPRPRGVNRGVAVWSDHADPADERVFFTPSTAGVLYALDARTGKPIDAFGENGRIDLRKDAGRDITGLTYGVTTPGVVYKDLIILGSIMGEGPMPAAPGNIRAYDVRTGKLRWRFDTVPPDAKFGGANNWGGMALDEKRGAVYVSTGSPTFDFYGGDRAAGNLYGNAVIALSASTGERLWHFQTTHHDTWDYDLPCQPILARIKPGGGKPTDTVVQLTKTGLVWVLDRDTGKPVFGSEERKVPLSDIEGEHSSPTQPFPLKPPPFARQTVTEDDLTDITPEARQAALADLRKFRAGKIYEPVSAKGTVVLPGFHGGALWGGGAFDPATGMLYVPGNNVPWVMTLIKTTNKPHPYEHTGYNRWTDPDGYPATKPPWGTITAYDLNKAKIAWQIPAGEMPALKAKGITGTGSEIIGGAIATAGGLLFMAGTRDEKFRAYDSKTGKILWETELPAGGYATPSTYTINGKQYLVIAAGGGGKQNTKAGDYFIAFALP